MAERVLRDNPWRNGRVNTPHDQDPRVPRERFRAGSANPHRLSKKEAGAFYTPDNVAATLVNWAVRDTADRMLDPSCGDGQFIARHARSVGIEQDAMAARIAAERAPAARIHTGEFFSWAADTTERFECAAADGRALTGRAAPLGRRASQLLPQPPDHPRGFRSRRLAAQLLRRAYRASAG